MYVFRQNKNRTNYEIFVAMVRAGPFPQGAASVDSSVGTMATYIFGQCLKKLKTEIDFLLVTFIINHKNKTAANTSVKMLFDVRHLFMALI